MSDAQETIGRQPWQKLLLAALTECNQVSVWQVLLSTLNRMPTRAELVACHRAARHLATSGKAVAGRVSDIDLNNRLVLVPVLGPVGTVPPQAESQRAAGLRVGWSQSTVSRVRSRSKRDWLELPRIKKGCP